MDLWRYRLNLLIQKDIKTKVLRRIQKTIYVADCRLFARNERCMSCEK